MVNALVNFALRGAQALFAIIVLGLSVGLIRGQKWPGSHIPVTHGYAAFVGGATLLGAFIGIASNWFELLQGIIGGAIDAFLTLINIAGGILLAYKLRGLNCNSNDYQSLINLAYNGLINGGCGNDPEGNFNCYYTYQGDRVHALHSRCRENQADSVFMFLTVVILIASMTMTFLHLKR